MAKIRTIQIHQKNISVIARSTKKTFPSKFSQTNKSIQYNHSETLLTFLQRHLLTSILRNSS